MGPDKPLNQRRCSMHDLVSKLGFLQIFTFRCVSRQGWFVAKNLVDITHYLGGQLWNNLLLR